MSEMKKTKHGDLVRKPRSEFQSTVMIKPREIIPIMAQSSDPLGSYTGVPAGYPDEKPVQDADDL